MAIHIESVRGRDVPDADLQRFLTEALRAAQRLSASAGFVREPDRDFAEGDRRFLFAADLG